MKKFILFVLFILITADLYSDSLKDKQQNIADQLAEIKDMGGDHLGYADEILKYLEERKIYPSRKERSRRLPYWMRRSRRRREQIDTYSLLSGGLAIRESLQLDSIVAANYNFQDKGIDISILKGPQIKSHPFDKMLKGKEYKISPLAAYCPQNFYYFHFNNMAASLNFFDYLSEVGGSIYKRYTPRSVDFKLKEKVLNQLALKENKAARNFYDSVIDEMVITGSDPFLIEGTDVTFIYKLKIPLVFKATIYNYRNEFKEKFNAQQKKVTISGMECEYLSTVDRKINSYLMMLENGIVIISNSKIALEKILAAQTKKISSLTDAADFKYMRSIYPLDKEKEDGFLYLSDAFIRYLVSPELRIKEARRLYESFRMAKLEKYLIYYYQVYNKYPESRNDIYRLIKRPELAKELKEKISKLKDNHYYKILLENINKYYSWNDLFYRNSEYRSANRERKTEIRNDAMKFINEFKNICKELRGYSPYNPKAAFGILEKALGSQEKNIFKDLTIADNKFSAISKRYGKNGYLEPNLENELKFVSNKEAEKYRSFIGNYNRYWKDFFDPIGIRIKMKNGIKVETCILPLINNSIYNSLAMAFGGKAVTLKNNNLPGEILSFSYKINQELINTQLVHFYKDVPELENGKIFDGLLDDQVHVHMLDRLPLFDFESNKIVTEMLRSSFRSRDIYLGFLLYALFHPVRISYAVKDANKAEQLLLILNRSINQNLSLLLSRYVKLDSYYYKYRNKLVYVLKMNFYNTLKFRMYFSVVNNAIEITTTKAYMDKIINSVNQKYIFDPVQNESNVRLVYRPSQMKKEKDLFKFNVYESAQNASFKNMATIKLLSLLFPDEADLQKKCLQLYNFAPVCPMGGKYNIDKKSGKISNSIFGSPENPYLKINKIKKDMTKRYFKTNQIRIDLKFTREGIKTNVLTE